MTEQRRRICQWTRSSGWRGGSSRNWLPPSGWPSCCTTCSQCPSTRSPRSWTARRTRLLASRARRRIQAAATVPDADLASQRKAVDAFFAASRTGDLGALLALLDPDVVARADYGPTPGASQHVRRAQAVARQTVMFSRLAPFVRPALVNGTAGAVVARGGDGTTIMAFTVQNGRIIEIDILADPAWLRRPDLIPPSDR